VKYTYVKCNIYLDKISLWSGLSKDAKLPVALCVGVGSLSDLTTFTQDKGVPMKRTMMLIVFLLVILSVCNSEQVKTSRQVTNLTAFARLYGYVKHFHPSDEAQEISWNRFAAYGSEQVINAKDDNELKSILMDLFTPLAPTLQLYSKAKDKQLDSGRITPPQTKGLKLTCWQYEGLAVNPPSPYSSFRTNRPFKIYKDPTYDMSKVLLNFVIPEIKTNFSKARLSFSVMQSPSDTSKLMCDANYGDEYLADSLSTSNWKRMSFVFDNVNPKKQSFNLRFYQYQAANMDSIRWEVFADNNWQTIYYNDFTSDTPGNFPSQINVNCSSDHGLTSANNEIKVVDNKGNKVLSILYTPEKEFTYGYMNKIFDEEAKFGEFIDKPLIKGLSCYFPLSLYCYNDHTYPPADSSKLNNLKSKLEPLDLQGRDNKYYQLAGLFNYWNQMNFFYPYWQYTKVNWEKELSKTIEKTLVATDFRSYKLALWELISKTRDGHAFLGDMEDDYKLPGLNVELIGKQWIVTRVADEALNLPLGSVVTKINNQPFGKFMQSNRKYFTYASKHKTDKMLFYMVMKAFPDSVASFTFKTPDKKTVTKVIPFKEYEGDPFFEYGKTIIRYSDDIYYLNTASITNEELNAMLPELAKAKGIIFDLRTYPSISPDFITHLLSAPDSLANYVIKRYIKPHEELPVDEKNPATGWNLMPAEPHISAKAVFLSSAFSISYCESTLAVLKYDKLGTIIGQASSGTNGNINRTLLPGGLALIWTGMFIENPDGSRFHGIGIPPDIYVKPTVEAYVQGRDAEIDAALGYLKTELKLAKTPEEIKEGM